MIGIQNTLASSNRLTEMERRRDEQNFLKEKEKAEEKNNQNQNQEDEKKEQVVRYVPKNTFLTERFWNAVAEKYAPSQPPSQPLL